MALYADDFDPLQDMAFYEEKFGTYEEMMAAYYWVPPKLQSSNKAWHKNIRTHTRTYQHKHTKFA